MVVKDILLMKLDMALNQLTQYQEPTAGSPKSFLI